MKKTIQSICIIALLFTFVFPVSALSRADLSQIQSWGYWLQDADIETLKKSPYDLVVIDYSADGSSKAAWSKRDIQSLKEAGKTVLAYLSIGEAEDYRFYWKRWWREGRPGFVGPENPDWEGNYKVKYWQKGWWNKAIRPYLNKIIDSGFDGVYLDIIDAYWYWHEEGGHDLKARANSMARLVENISRYSRSKAGDSFITCPQNGISILDDAVKYWQRRYLNAIDCVGMEDLFFNTWSPDDQQYRLELLKQIDAHKKPIFSIDYIDHSQYKKHFSIINNNPLNIIGYTAAPDRELDELIIIDQNNSPTSNNYPIHKDIFATLFWVGENASPDNTYIQNRDSAWDELWMEHFGGVDTPDKRNGYYPAGFTPLENPFYFALPFNEFDENGRKPDLFKIVYWAGKRAWQDNESMLKNRWIKITNNDHVAYAQWEDVGPFKEDDSDYVFGNHRPSSAINNHAGLDLSPAVWTYLKMKTNGPVDWQFVDYKDVPEGPWKDIVTTSAPYWE